MQLYFATLTEVPILSTFMAAGMGNAPAHACLVAGPGLSLPGILVLRRIMGTRKTCGYPGVAVVMATIAEVLFGLVR